VQASCGASSSIEHGIHRSSSNKGSSHKGSSSSAAKALGDLLGVNPQQALLLRDLQELRLKDCRLPSPDSLLQLAAAATRLTCLDIRNVSWFNNDSSRTGVRFSPLAVKAVIAAMLQQHQRLAVVQLPYIPLGHAAAQHVCTLGGLRELSMCMAAGLSASCFKDLPSTVTRLEIDNYRYGP
jgi:hypothetical protein